MFHRYCKEGSQPWCFHTRFVEMEPGLNSPLIVCKGMERVIGSWWYDIVSRRIICTHTVSAKDIYTIEVRNYDCLYQNKELTVSAPKSRDALVQSISGLPSWNRFVQKCWQPKRCAEVWPTSWGLKFKGLNSPNPPTRHHIEVVCFLPPMVGFSQHSWPGCWLLAEARCFFGKTTTSTAIHGNWSWNL